MALTPSNQLRTEGFATASMIGSVLGAVVNIILDPVMIFGLGWVRQVRHSYGDRKCMYGYFFRVVSY